MSWEDLFGLANLLALTSWGLLLLAPRWQWLIGVLRYGVPGVLSVAYVVLIGLTFFGIEGGGFNTLAEVKTLLSVDPMLLGGWVHYLAFDLVIGTFIAERSEVRGISRLIQAPILVATFMFGPIGYLLFVGMEAAAESGARQFIKGASS